MRLEKVTLPFDVELPPVRQLAMGNITCMYENGNLRYIKCRKEEIIRMIYTAVRDEHWATAPYDIKDEIIEEHEESFSIRYTALYKLNDVHYKASIQIDGKQNRISFYMKGEALSDFLRNRIGICVHHPIKECAGKEVHITRPDGISEKAVFPVMINPHQAFTKVQKMNWEISSANASLELKGDVFETEDQRNWTDYSYKTYSTPLELPFPVQVKKGDTLEQKVSLVVTAKENSGAFHEINAPTQPFDKLPFPKIGYERAQGSPHLTKEDIDYLRQIPFDHYRINLSLSEPDWNEELQNGASEAKQLNAQLELVAFFSSVSGEQLLKLLEILREYSQQVMSVLLLEEGKAVTTRETLQEVHNIIKADFSHVKIGFGTNGFFAELNRNRPATDLPFDFLSYSLNPQVHASDPRSLMENLEAQEDTIKTIQTFAPGKAIHISPVTFKIRAADTAVSGSPVDEDRRMYTFFGAMWTLLAIKNLSRANCITFYQAKGYRGVLNDNFRPHKSQLYNVLKKLKQFGPKEIIQGETTNMTFLVENERGEQLQFLWQDAF